MITIMQNHHCQVDIEGASQPCPDGQMCGTSHFCVLGKNAGGAGTHKLCTPNLMHACSMQALIHTLHDYLQNSHLGRLLASPRAPGGGRARGVMLTSC